MLHIKVNGNPLVPEKMIFKGFYHILACWRSWSCDIILNHFHLHVPKLLQTNFQILVKNGPVVSEKASFNFDM